MLYEKELGLLQDTFGRCGISLQTVTVGEPVEEEWARVMRRFAGRSHLVILSEPFAVGRMVMPLPHSHPEQMLLIGPYLTRPHSPEEIWEWAESMGHSPAEARQWQGYYSRLPVLSAGSPLFALLDAFGERVWGDSFAVTEAGREPVPVSLDKETSEPEDILRQMEEVATRYAHENRLIRMVEQGQTHQADRWLARLSTMPLEKRSADPVRNLKNYSIIMNTLLRKAAERGGVHPYHVDEVSSEFARQIENAESLEGLQDLMTGMFRRYCRLVRDHAMKPYSPPVQRALTVIHADLTANLRLSRLAGAQNISGAYLSALFREELGVTLTAYVTARRMELAENLLATTHLQIQTVAQHCGMMDVQYFSKVFKKHTGMTPKEYRENPPKG